MFGEALVALTWNLTGGSWFGWLSGCLLGLVVWLSGCSVGWLVVWLSGCLVLWFFGSLVGWLLVVFLVVWLFGLVWLVAWLVAWCIASIRAASFERKTARLQSEGLTLGSMLRWFLCQAFSGWGFCYGFVCGFPWKY